MAHVLILRGTLIGSAMVVKLHHGETDYHFASVTQPECSSGFHMGIQPQSGPSPGLDSYQQEPEGNL